MRLTYWVADALDDSRAYSIRARTRTRCRKLVLEQGQYAEGYGILRKVVVEYKVTLALGEGGIE